MSDDLVKRLREPIEDPFFGPLIEPIKKEAADRITELEAALQNLVYEIEHSLALVHLGPLRSARVALSAPVKEPK